MARTIRQTRRVDMGLRRAVCPTFGRHATPAGGMQVLSNLSSRPAIEGFLLRLRARPRRLEGVGAVSRIRTVDPIITNDVLYQLS